MVPSGQRRSLHVPHACTSTRYDSGRPEGRAKGDHVRDLRAAIAVLGRLHELCADQELALAFRQGMASLAQVARDPAAVPFAALEPEDVQASVQLALTAGLLDDLSFLSGPSAASALYALASVLPLGVERRELGRRVLVYLQQGDAETFLALATALALGTTRAFEGPSVRARLALVLLLPAQASARVDPLAFTLLSQRELATRFVIEPATADLPARRLSARLVERAARYAALRAQHGDDGELAIFEAPHVQALCAQLLSDREPLVFRHAAVARGLLSAYLPRCAEELERDLMASHSLSWVRRGATSLAARIAVRPGEALGRARELLSGLAFARDPGLAAALLHGLARAAEVEPEAAEALMLAAVERGGLLAAEALLDLRRELADDARCRRAAELAWRRLRPSESAVEVRGLGRERNEVEARARAGERNDVDARGLAGESSVEARGLAGEPHVDARGPAREPNLDGGQSELLTIVRAELDPSAGAPRAALPEQLAQALLIHARSGPLAAFEPARAVLAAASEHVDRLAALDAGQGEAARLAMYRLLYELDLVLLESSALFDLLATGAGAAESARATASLTALLTRLTDLLIAQEETPHQGSAPAPYLALRLRRLRTLLHLLDVDFRPAEEQTASVRAVQLGAVRKLCERVATDAPSAMDQIVHGALARGVDALVRGEVLELADVVLCQAGAVPLPEGLLALAQGCLLPNLKRALRALSSLLSGLDPVAGAGPRALVGALSELAHAIPSDASPRTEALRRALLGLARALEAILAARSIGELVQARRALILFENAVIELAYLSRGARRRLGLAPGGLVIDESPVAGLARALESAVAQGALEDLVPTLEWLQRELARTLPALLARAVSRVLMSLAEWPLEGAERPSAELLLPATAEACPLPAWLPPSRRLAGFFVVRPLGAGLASSVFLVKRNEERDAREAPDLVLKVPRYDASAARVLSEAQFDEAFARELPGLLSLPPDEHLASVVSVETRALPKPFLVMERIEGPTLARVRKRKLDPVHVLDGVVAGLEVLHAAGLGHCDLTPSHVILRVRGGELQPVLVDFGLAGRHVRPGCGQAAYAAPELWLDQPTTPMAIDVYAVGCLAYELVTGRPLFHAASEYKVAQAHAAHDGVPPGLLELAKEPRNARLAEWITLCLRRDPAQRASAVELRRELRAI